VTPGLDALLPFAAFWFVAVMTPGPNTLLFTWIALTQTRETTLAVIAGILSCGILWAFGGLFGLVWIMRSFPTLFKAVEILGGIYIGWRGIVLLRHWWTHKAREIPGLKAAAQISPARAWRMGFLTNLSNPKSLAFVASLFATTSVAKGPLWLGLLGIAVMLSMSAGYYFTLYGLFSRPGFLTLYRSWQNRIEAMAGLIFVFFGGELILRGVAVLV
jgi:threonine/homoserine/homoserine lactone efflux protein